MTNPERKHELRCSFCRKHQDDVKRLVAGPGVYICDECIELCNDILEEELRPAEPVLPDKDVTTPVRCPDCLGRTIISVQKAQMQVIERYERDGQLVAVDTGPVVEWGDYVSRRCARCGRHNLESLDQENESGSEP